MLPKITDTNPEAEKIQALLIPNLAKPELKRDKFMMCSGSAISQKNRKRGAVMKFISKNDAKNKVDQIFDFALDSHEKVVISSDRGNLVIIPENEWEQLQETLKLFKDKVALEALLKGHKIRDNGGKPDGKTISEVFDDLVD